MIRKKLKEVSSNTLIFALIELLSIFCKSNISIDFYMTRIIAFLSIYCRGMYHLNFYTATNIACFCELDL